MVHSRQQRKNYETSGGDNIMSDNSKMPIELLLGKGLKLDLKVYKKLKAFQAGGEFWEHQSQAVIREHIGDFLPIMNVNEQDESVLCQLFVDGKEVASGSRPAKGVPSKERSRLEGSIRTLKNWASSDQIDATTKQIIEEFKLPDPNKDPELYRLYGSRWNPRLMVVWGCEKVAGSSVLPEEAYRRVAKESVGSSAFRRLPLIVFLLLLVLAAVWAVNEYDLIRKGDPVAAVDHNGDPVMDDKGNPVPAREDGRPIVTDENGNAIIGDDGEPLPDEDKEETTLEKILVMEGPDEAEDIPEDGKIKPGPPREAGKNEVNLAKLTRPGVITIAVADSSGDYSGLGSGFVMTSDGLIVTNHHVIDGGDSFDVLFSDGTVLGVKEILFSDEKRDLAVLRVSSGGRELPFLDLAAEDRNIGVGEKIAVMGSPHGLAGTFTTGIVSAKRSDESVDMLQITAPISPGSSGSPVVDSNASVVGIVTGAVVEDKAQSLNFAIDISELRELLSKSGGTARKSVENVKSEQAVNRQEPDQIPESAGVGRAPKDGKTVVWKKDPVYEKGDPKPASEAAVMPSEIALKEVSREQADGGKIKIVLAAKLKTGSKLSDLSDLEAKLNGKSLEITGSHIIISAVQGTHELNVSGQDPGNGKSFELAADIDVKIESTVDIKIRGN